MNVVASVLMLTGALLTLVAAVGVLRFPDVLSRLHAATKAASVGIALVLLGAGAALGWGPFAFMTLVAVFQIITAPVAGHALGRSALPESEPGRVLTISPFPLAIRVVGLMVLWVVLWQEFTAANLLGGLVVGLVVTGITTRRSGKALPLRPFSVIRFGLGITIQLVSSTITVAIAALGPRRLISPDVRTVPLGPGSTSALVAAANAVSLTPGTLTLAVDTNEPTLTVHLLRPDDDAIDGIVSLYGLAVRAFPIPPDPDHLQPPETTG